MIFTDIKNRVYFLTGSTSASYPIADLTLSANNAVEHIVGLINKSDNRWQFEDTNQSDLPIATTTITSGQQDYSLDTVHHTIDRVEIKDSNGDWHLLKQIDQQRLKGDKAVALNEYKSVNGDPREYDILGSTIMLYPIPDYTLADALKIYFTRGPVPFTTADTTESPGFNSLFHDLVPLWVAYDYAFARGKSNAGSILEEIARKERDLEMFYQTRNRDMRGRFTPSTDSNK